MLKAVLSVFGASRSRSGDNNGTQVSGQDLGRNWDNVGSDSESKTSSANSTGARGDDDDAEEGENQSDVRLSEPGALAGDEHESQGMGDATASSSSRPTPRSASASALSGGRDDTDSTGKSLKPQKVLEAQVLKQRR